MPFPFSVEGRIEVSISAPEKAPLVGEGLQQWLAKSAANDVEWNGTNVSFSGDTWGERTFRHRPLHGVGRCHVTLAYFPEKVVMEYSVTIFTGPAICLGAVLFLAISVSAIGDPRRLLFLPLLVFFFCIHWVTTRFSCPYEFRVAATQGLADGAERELAVLRAL